MNIRLSKVVSESQHLLALRNSLPVENNLSTATLDGTDVLNLTNSFARAGSPKKVASLRSILEEPSSQVTNRLCAFAFMDLSLEPEPDSLDSVMAAKKSSPSRSSVLPSEVFPEKVKNQVNNHTFFPRIQVASRV